MRILRIFDVSPFVHAGKVNKHAYLLPPLEDTPDGFRERKILCGGVSMIWNILYQEYGKCDMVFCCDRIPAIKQGMYEQYKSNRVHNPEVSKMKEACEYILKDCGFTTLYEEGYEADDFIYSIVQENKNRYDHLYIYTGDSDLYFLVDDNVTVLPSSSRAKTVTKQNYTYTVRSDEFTPYNSLTFFKILYGDISDSIPGLRRDLAHAIAQTFNTPFYQPLLGNKEAAISLIGMFGSEARAQAELVFPLDVRVPTEFAQGDKLKIAEWGDAFKNKFWRTGGKYTDRIESCIAEMADMGLASDA